MKARFVTLWTAAVIAAAAAFVTHLALRFETVRLGYALGKAQTEHRLLLEKKRLLSIEAAALRQSARVETVARATLGMQLPTRDSIVSIDDSIGVSNSGSVR